MYNNVRKDHSTILWTKNATSQERKALITDEYKKINK